MNMRKTIYIAALAFSLSGCFIFGTGRSRSSQSTAREEPKNHGQARSAEVHERNEERKEAKDAAKEEKKDNKK